MAMTGKMPRTTLPPGIAKVLKRLHYPLDVILLCVRWYVAYSLSLRNLEEMMAEPALTSRAKSVFRITNACRALLGESGPANGRQCGSARPPMAPAYARTRRDGECDQQELHGPQRC
jgi:hypothetical protein